MKYLPLKENQTKWYHDDVDSSGGASQKGDTHQCHITDEDQRIIDLFSGLRDAQKAAFILYAQDSLEEKSKLSFAPVLQSAINP